MARAANCIVLNSDRDAIWPLCGPSSQLPEQLLLPLKTTIQLDALPSGRLQFVVRHLEPLSLNALSAGFDRFHLVLFVQFATRNLPQLLVRPVPTRSVSLAHLSN